MARWDTGKLEAVACNHCGSHESREVIVRPDGLTVCECRVCGLAYLNPRPTADRIERLYTAEYFSKVLPDVAAAKTTLGYSNYFDAAETAWRSRVMQKRLDWVLGMCSSPSPRLLEIGCATGEFAAAAQARGARVTAIDISDDVIQLARQRYRDLDFRTASIEELAPSGNLYDAVVAFEVIEHVLSPRDFLSACTQVLAPGGILVYSTPNYRTARILQDAWIGFHTSFAHLYFFSDESLARMGQAAGLEVLEWKTTGDGRMPPPDRGARGWLKHTLHRTGVLPLVRAARTYVRTLTRGEEYVPFGSGHTLLMALRKPATALAVRRAA